MKTFKSWTRKWGLGAVLAGLMFSFAVQPLWAENQNLTVKTEDTAPTGDDLVYVVNDPAGTPADRKVTLTNLLTSLLGLGPWVVGVDSAGTGNVVDIWSLRATTTGTAANGIGAGLTFNVEDASGNLDEAMSIDAVYTTAAHASQVAAMRINLLGTLSMTLSPTALTLPATIPIIAPGGITIHDTTADVTVTKALMTLKYNDDGDADANFIEAYDNAGADLKFRVGPDGAVIGYSFTATGPGTSTVGVLAVDDEVYDATGWDSDLSVPTKNAIRDKIETLGGGGSGVALPSFKALTVSYTSATTVTITASSALLTDASDLGKVFDSVSETAIITTSGIGGLEASDTEASGTWYEVWLMGKSDGTIDALLNAAGGAITTVPAGYAYSGRVGYVRNNGSSDFIEFYQDGDRVDIFGVEVLSAGSATTYTDVNLSGYIPPGARKAILNLTCVGGTGNCYARRNGSTFDATNYSTGATRQATANNIIIGCDSSQLIEYLVDNAAADLYIDINGYIDNL